MTNYFICKTCGVQFAATDAPPASCPICQDDRQYVGLQGQQWTTLAELQQQDYHNVVTPAEPGLSGIGTQPSFAIGQRALLVQSSGGNVLWDCISLIDDETVDNVRALGGISAIAISHPHYYASVIEWSHIFDAPVYLHAADRNWVMRPDPRVVFWEGKTRHLIDDLTLIRCGGHFAGGTVCHWASGCSGSGVLLSGDIINVVSDRRYVSFMYSYPNLIPLSVMAVRGIVEAVAPFAFDRIYGAWWDRIVPTDGKAAVTRSADRYIAAITGDYPPDGTV